LLCVPYSDLGFQTKEAEKQQQQQQQQQQLDIHMVLTNYQPK